MNKRTIRPNALPAYAYDPTVDGAASYTLAIAHKRIALLEASHARLEAVHDDTVATLRLLSILHARYAAALTAMAAATGRDIDEFLDPEKEDAA